MEIWNNLSKLVDYVQLIIVALMLILVALGVFMFFASATGYESSFTSEEFKILLGDVLLILVTVELIKTIIIYAHSDNGDNIEIGGAGANAFRKVHRIWQEE